MWNSAARIFAPDWVREVQRRYPDTLRYTTPFIVRLAFEPRFSNERNKIEEWFEAIPEQVKIDTQRRLRSEDSHQHYGAYYELVMYAFFSKMGYSVDIHPKVEEGKPDLLVSGNNLRKPVFIAVATAFDDPAWQKEQQKLHQMMQQLYQIEHYFFVHVSVLSNSIPDIVDYWALKEFDNHIPKIFSALHDDDLLFITADHGCDPTIIGPDPNHPFTDHTREHVPIFALGKPIRSNVDLGIRSTFGDIGQTIAEFFGVKLDNGESFLHDILKRNANKNGNSSASK